MIEYVGLLFTDRIIAVNTAIRQEIMETIGKWKKMEVEVLFNNIPEIKRSSPEDITETRNHLGIPKQAKIFVTAGILTPRKNIEVSFKEPLKIQEGRIGFYWSLVITLKHEISSIRASFERIDKKTKSRK